MTTPVTVAPEVLTFEDIKSWDGATMKDQMRHPEMREAVYRVISSKSRADVEAAQATIDLNTPSIDSGEPIVAVVPPEEIAAAEAEAQQAAAREIVRQEAETAETEQLRAAGISVQRDQHGNISKLIQDYQVTDENKVPIGRLTHLEARSWPELAVKQKEAHSQATRAFSRLKSQKISFKDQQSIVPAQQSDAELLTAMKDLKSDDPQKQLDAIRKVQKSESDRINAEAAELNRQTQVSQRFLASHKHDFNNCKANIELVKEYFEQNPELAWTDDNLEICLHALELRLAPVESVAFSAPANPAASTPVAPIVPTVAPTVHVQPAATPAVQPGLTATALATPPANPAVIAPRPGVNGGLIPGESSGSRPVLVSKPKLTAEEIKSWDGPTMRAKMRNPQIRPLIEQYFADRAQGKR